MQFSTTKYKFTLQNSSNKTAPSKSSLFGILIATCVEQSMSNVVTSINQMSLAQQVSFWPQLCSVEDRGSDQRDFVIVGSPKYCQVQVIVITQTVLCSI